MLREAACFRLQVLLHLLLKQPVLGHPWANSVEFLWLQNSGRPKHLGWWSDFCLNDVYKRMQQVWEIMCYWPSSHPCIFGISSPLMRQSNHNSPMSNSQVFEAEWWQGNLPKSLKWGGFLWLASCFFRDWSQGMKHGDVEPRYLQEYHCWIVTYIVV